MDKDGLQHEIIEVLQLGANTIGEDTEEFFITDYEWEDVDLFEVKECSNPYELNEQLEQVSSMCTDELQVIRFLLDDGFADTVVNAVEKLDDVIVYKNQSMEDVAIEYIESCYNLDSIPNIITNNIDYKGIACGLECSGCYFEVEGNIYEYVG